MGKGNRVKEGKSKKYLDETGRLKKKPKPENAAPADAEPVAEPQNTPEK